MSMEKYKISTNPVCPPESVVQGEKFRFSILTPSLVRMEYCDDGIFEDRATQTVWFRDFAPCAYKVEDKEEELIIFTEFMEIHYDRKPFSPNGLSVKVTGKGVGNGRFWHYGEEPRDLLGTYRTLDQTDGGNLIDSHAIFQGLGEFQTEAPKKISMGHGILSREGFSYFDDGKSMILTGDGWIEERKAGITDMYFFGYGHRYLEALKDFYHLCGKTPLLPRYALGNWWSRYYRYTEEEYMELISRFEKEEIPFSVSVVDMDWHLVDDVDPKYGSGWTGYTWNTDFFPDPERFMQWLHDHNLKITLNVHPADGVRAFEKLYPRVAAAMGIDPASELPVICDLADPKYVETYFEELHHPLEEEGVDFWWIDWQQGGVTKKAGLDPLWMLNHYHYLDSKWKGNRPLTFSRYAGVGSHRYPVGFSGDTVISWESLDFQPYFTSTASNIGYGWWSHDIGGHMLGTKDDELMSRWVQLGVFSPINRLHSSNNPFSGKEPWKYGRTTRAVMEKFLRLRHGLVPYLYSMNHRANYEDMPLIWPMYYANPDEPAAYVVPNEYYFGSELLVAAITQPKEDASRLGGAKAYLPEGLWADFFHGMVYDGGRTTTLWRNEEEYPVLMKAGAIVPLKNMDEFDNSTANPEQMEVKIFPAAENSFILWEDAGDTPADTLDNWASTCMTTAPASFIIAPAEGNVEVIPAKRSWKLVFTAVENTKVTVTADNVVMEAKVSYEKRSGSLIVEIPFTDISRKIEVSAEGGFVIRKNPVEAYCHEILETAFMGFEAKSRAMTAIRSGRKIEDKLTNLELPDSVFKALMEVISAN